MSDRAKGLLLAALTAFSWSILAIGIKFALQVVSSETIVWFRFFTALTALLMLIIIFDKKQLRILKKWPPLAVLTGGLLALNFFGYQKGVELTTASNAQVLIQGAPITLMFCGIFFFGERPRLIQWIGLSIAILGLGTFFSDQLSSTLENRDEFILGNFWLLIAIVTWASYGSLQKVLTKQGWRPQEINLVLYSVAFVLLFPTADTSEFANVDSWVRWAVMIYLGLNTLVAYGALGYALKLAPASQVSMVITCNPLGTLLIMKILEINQVTWIKTDKLTTMGLIGAVMVVGGVILAVSKPPKTAES